MTPYFLHHLILLSSTEFMFSMHATAIRSFSFKPAISLLAGLILLGNPLLMHAMNKDDRKYFLKAETALNKGDQKTWRKLAPRLTNYPLYADLLFKQAMQNIGRVKQADADQNLQNLSNTPLRKTYLKSWLRHLVSRKQWQRYIDYYESGLGTRYECHYADALYRTGQPDKARIPAEKLWLVGKSQIKQCDPVFRAMKQQGQLIDSLIWDRIELAIKKGQTRLVKYLKKALPGQEKKYVTEWLSIRSRPSRVLAGKYMTNPSPRRQKMLVYGIKRMALFEADKALAKWSAIRNRVQLAPEDVQDIERYIALRLTTQRIDGAVSQHQQVSQQNKTSLEWAVRAAVREGNMPAVGRFIDQMGEITSLEDRWKYWKAKSAGHAGDQLTASTLLRTLASGRGYHNFLAADELNSPYQLNNKPLQYIAKDIEALKQHYNVRRAEELYALGRIPEARREWYYLIKQFGDADRQKLAYIQKQWGWDSQAILTIATADYYDDLSLRFPVAFEKEISKYTRQRKLDKSWVMALMRQESAFQHDARSHAGARGLMQLMPATSRQVARQLRIRRPGLRDLYKPDTNVKLGTQYLKSNLQKFNQNKVLTTAGYNAGPHRVSKWLAKSPSMSAAAWTETIPFKETRHYVQRIMSYASIYDFQLGKTITRMRDRMDDIQP